jgi:hypothetical protein
MCEKCERLMERVTDLVGQVAATNRLLQDWQRIQIPRYLTQARNYQLNATSLETSTQTQMLIRVTSILVITTSPGLLTILERQIPVTGTVSLYLGPHGMLIRPEDVLTLTQQTAGNLGIELFGEEMVDRGHRW